MQTCREIYELFGKDSPSLSSANQFLSLLFAETDSLESDRSIELISNGLCADMDTTDI